MEMFIHDNCVCLHAQQEEPREYFIDIAEALGLGYYISDNEIEVTFERSNYDKAYKLLFEFSKVYDFEAH